MFPLFLLCCFFYPLGQLSGGHTKIVLYQLETQYEDNIEKRTFTWQREKAFKTAREKVAQFTASNIRSLDQYDEILVSKEEN